MSDSDCIGVIQQQAGAVRDQANLSLGLYAIRECIGESLERGQTHRLGKVSRLVKGVNLIAECGPAQYTHDCCDTHIPPSTDCVSWSSTLLHRYSRWLRRGIYHLGAGGV